MLCSPWLDLEALPTGLCMPCTVEDFAEGVLAGKILEASHLLYLASGQQFPGICCATIRPCLGCGGGQFLAYAGGGSRQITSCSCHGYEGAGGIGCTAAGVVLPGGPIREITEVLLNGTALDPSGYRLADGNVLMRVGSSWPCHQRMDLETSEDGTWSVEYEYGADPGPAGWGAVAALACELANACTEGRECRLPDRLQSLSREGVTMTILDPFDFLDNARFGLREVDQWLALVNPKGIDRPGKWFSTATIGNLHR